MLKLLKLWILCVLFLTLTSQIVKAEFVPYSSFPAYLGIQGGTCRPCQNINLDEAKLAYTQMSEAAGSTAMYAGKVAMEEVCYGGFLPIRLEPETYPYKIAPYTDGYMLGRVVPEQDYTNFVYGTMTGERISTGIAESDWQDRFCSPSPHRTRELKEIRTVDFCQTYNYTQSQCESLENSRRRYAKIYSYRPSIVIKKRGYTIFLTSDERGLLRREMYTSLEPGNYTPVAYNLEPPTERVPQNKEPKQCAKDAFMDKFPFDFFNVGGSGNIQNCITTNFFGIRKELCGLQPIIKNFQIATTIAFIIAFYLYL